jgi:shikimate kinase
MNIVLIGFMGTGKTAVADALARRLGWERIDTDALIVERAGMSIPDIFAQDGEPHFRDLETAVIRDLAGKRRCVVSTGGGCVMRVDNLRALRATGTVISLAARPDVIMARCKGDTNRPLLQGENPLATIHELLGLRSPLYAQAHHTVDTSDLTIDQVVDAIVALVPGMSGKKS